MLKLKANFADRFALGDVHHYQGDFNAGTAGRILESVLFVGDFCAQGVKFLHKLFPLVCIGVADRLGVEDAGDLAAVLHDVQGLEQVSGPGGKRGIHGDGCVLFAGPEGEKVIMYHPEAVLFEHGAEVGGKLDAIKVKGLCLTVPAGDLPSSVLAVDTGGPFDGPGDGAVPGGRLQDGLGQVCKPAAVVTGP